MYRVWLIFIGGLLCSEVLRNWWEGGEERLERGGRGSCDWDVIHERIIKKYYFLWDTQEVSLSKTEIVFLLRTEHQFTNASVIPGLGFLSCFSCMYHIFKKWKLFHKHCTVLCTLEKALLQDFFMSLYDFYYLFLLSKKKAVLLTRLKLHSVWQKKWLSRTSKCLVYKVSAKITRTTQKNLVSKDKIKQHHTTKKEVTTVVSAMKPNSTELRKTTNHQPLPLHLDPITLSP